MEILIAVEKLKSGIKSHHRKESKLSSGFKLLKINASEKEVEQVLDVRFYWAGHTCYCCLWGSFKGELFDGSGKAGGYGYEKESAALDAALTSAGIMVKDLSGTGQTKEAIDKIAKLMEIEFYHIVKYHG